MYAPAGRPVLDKFSGNSNFFRGVVRLIFGDCEFDAGRRVVIRHRRVIPVSPKAFQLLALLLDRRPEVVSKTELLEHLWPGTFVSDASLHNLVAEIRAALGDRSRMPRYIRTVPRYGYAFHADARLPDRLRGRPSSPGHSGPRLVSPKGDWLLTEGPNTVGRDPECAVKVDSRSVSRRHARITVKGRRASVEDLRSKNGTFVDGVPVKHSVPVEDGSEIRVGSVTMTYRNRGDVDSTLSLRDYSWRK
jgi:DNA-binding winged helix-turn-helix (wHTH) protein